MKGSVDMVPLRLTGCARKPRLVRGLMNEVARCISRQVLSTVMDVNTHGINGQIETESGEE